jgi:hypothetical protein
VFARGETDFQRLRERGRFFVDNTSCIPFLEYNGRFVRFSRPPRFGKSLFVDMLAQYYDAATTQSQFDAMFGGLDIHQNVTPLARSFLVLRLDLSLVNFHAGAECESLGDTINASLLEFRSKYNLDFDICGDCAWSSLYYAGFCAQRTKQPIYVFVDHMDSFVHDLVDRHMYKPTKSFAATVPGSSSVAHLFEIISKFSGERRLLATGVVPLVFDADFFFPRALDYDRDFSATLGFRTRDLVRALDQIPRLSADQRRDALDLMCRHFNRYFFRGCDEPLYNTAQSLFLLDHLATGLRDIKRLMALDAARDPILHRTLLDPSVVPSSGFLDYLRSVPTFSRELASVLGDPVLDNRADARFKRCVTLDAGNLHANSHYANTAESLLQSLGVATFADATRQTLTVPTMARRALLDAQL